MTREQVRRVDQIAIEQFAVPGIVLMENASRNAADIIRRCDLSWQRPIILCGGGNNGGDGLAIARHLANAGGQPTIALCTDPAKYTGDALINWTITQRMALCTIALTPANMTSELPGNHDLVIDAIFGTGLTTAPRPPFDEIANAVNQSGLPIIAIDIPSGLDCDTGQPLGGTAIRATMTITFVARKQGFQTAASSVFTGQLKIADIGCPQAAIQQAIRQA